MKVLFKVDDEGNGYVAALEAPIPGESVAEHRKSANIGKGQQIELDVPDVLTSDQIGFGNVTDSESGDVVTEMPGSGEGQPATDPPGGGNEGSSVAGQDQGQPADPDAAPPEPGTPADQTTDPESDGANAGGGEGGQPPAPASGEGAGDGEQQSEQPSDQPTTSAASEKPLYLVEGDGEAPEGFVASGLETPDGKTLFHFEGDTAGQTATGNSDAVSVYADADDDGQPVKPAEATEATEGQEQQPAA